jgi:membrane protein DedA with SNARE-associated domain
MSLTRFVGFTVLGSGIWVSILVVLGYVAGRELERVTDAEIKALWERYSTQITVGLILFCVIVIAAYILWHRRRRRTDTER